jgi:O-acetylhomoserine (thiol)-lyase
MNAFQILQGIETLSLRMQRHVSNTLEVAHYLESHAQVRKVSYPGLTVIQTMNWPSSSCPKDVARSFQLSLRAIAIRVVPSVEALQVFSHLANVGDARSLVIHPASTTHFRMDEQALKAAGIGEATLRLSIGLEDPDDLIDDLKRAFRVAFPKR